MFKMYHVDNAGMAKTIARPVSQAEADAFWERQRIREVEAAAARFFAQFDDHRERFEALLCAACKRRLAKAGSE